jgi:3-hydroxyacyl-CoA dehydrogenase
VKLRSAVVLGAGVMGSQIAAMLANAGMPVTLLDVTQDAAREGLDRAKKLKPDPFFTPDAARLIRTASFDEDLPSIGRADWIVEAIVERLDAKASLLARVEQHRRADAIVSSNTSGIPIAAIGEGRSDAFRRHWLGTHFFNPPRYLRLLEVIPTERTDPDVVRTIAEFADVRLGKGVVASKDTPGFIANRIALVGVAALLRAVASGEATVEEIDAITGPAIGRPRSATFRTMDIAGVDILVHVARDLSQRLSDREERAQFTLPPFVDEMVARGMTGAKAGRGFYEKRGEEIWTLDPSTLDYRARQDPRLPSLDAAKSIESAEERIRTLVNGTDKVARILQSTFVPTLEYARKIAPEIAYSAADVDRAMRWGFGWDLGPLETLALLGSDPQLGQFATVDGVRAPASKSPQASNFVHLASVSESAGSDPNPWQIRPSEQILRTAKARNAVVRRNPGASLVDLGDGVACVEFHSKMNAIGGDTIQMIQSAVKDAAAGFAALVVGNDAANFSAGANLMLLLLEAQEGNWDDVDMMVRTFQGATMALRYADVPVVVAPAGLTLGGACEIALHATRVQAHAETYIGLVETGVGLIPAGGGTKEMLARAMDALPAGADLLPPTQRVFETIAFAKVSTSAADAVRIGYLTPADAITMNRDRLLTDAKRQAAQLAAAGYRPLQPRSAIRVGGESVQAALKLGVHLAWRAGRISDYDGLIGRKLAWILAGGNMKAAGTITEQQLLDLEREAFLSLCGERKTLERIGYTLKTGKPLRN